MYFVKCIKRRRSDGQVQKNGVWHMVRRVRTLEDTKDLYMLCGNSSYKYKITHGNNIDIILFDPEDSYDVITEFRNALEKGERYEPSRT